MIAPVRGVAAFDALRRSRRRSRQGPITVTCAMSPPNRRPEHAIPAVAFAIGRAVGPAVVRNRLRRRLRTIMRQEAPALAPGLYLLSVTPSAAELTYQELSTTVHLALRSLPEAPTTPGAL